MARFILKQPVIYCVRAGTSRDREGRQLTILSVFTRLPRVTGLPEQVTLTSIENVLDIEVRNGPGAFGIESHSLDKDFQCVGSTCLVHSVGAG